MRVVRRPLRVPEQPNIEVVIYPRAGDGERPPVNYPAVALLLILSLVTAAVVGWWLSEPKPE